MQITNNMEISIGDIIDRFTICKLKSERGNIDMSEEMGKLSEEINKHSNLETYIEQLYKINGDIWDLESDIRQGKEDLLGLEEVGRRAIRIREHNNKRIGVKNQINSITKTGFIETKISHASDNEPSVVISLTTVPERLRYDGEDGLKMVLRSLCEQIDDDYEVHFNIPEIYKPTGEKYEIPEWLNDFKLNYPHLKIFRPEDIGPPTKVVPTIQRLKNPETIIIVVDDDLEYHKEMIIEHRKYQIRVPDSVIAYEGRGATQMYYKGHLRDIWVLCTTIIREINELIQHYKSASYKRKLFGQDFFDNYVGRTLSDDVLVSKYFKNKRIRMVIVPYEKDNYLYETNELWSQNQRAESFPVIRKSNTPMDTGCNHPKLLEIEPKFYDPGDLGVKKVEQIVKEVTTFDTDKFGHGYIPFYDEEFKILKNVKNVLEIGVWKGESLRWLSYKFPDAIIHGIDVMNNCEFVSDKIRLYHFSQEDREMLNNFMSNVENYFDLIIDDGGHNMEQQQTSFGVLFKLVKPGGLYVIEDLHTSNWDMFKKPNDLISTLDMLNKLKETGKIISNYITDEEKNYIENRVEDIKIWTRTESFADSVTSVIKKINVIE